ncbi:hypothetical protein ACEQPO_24305 [Bacillus sp. SL00103]
MLSICICFKKERSFSLISDQLPVSSIKTMTISPLTNKGKGECGECAVRADQRLVLSSVLYLKNGGVLMIRIKLTDHT